MRVTRRFIPVTWIIGCLVWSLTSVCGATTIDNPDLPDQAHRFEQRWTQDRFGTSASLSASGHRTALTKARVIALWRYAADAS